MSSLPMWDKKLLDAAAAAFAAPKARKSCKVKAAELSGSPVAASSAADGVKKQKSLLETKVEDPKGAFYMPAFSVLVTRD